MNDTVLIFSYSERTSLELAKRLRGEHVFSVILPGTTTARQAAEYEPRGIILSGEDSGSGVMDASILEMGVPVLALGHAAHMMLTALGGACAGTGISRRKVDVHFEQSVLFARAEDGERFIREAQTLMLPASVRMSASGAGCTLGFEDPERRLYGIQFEMERNDPTTTGILEAFLFDVCGCDPWYSVDTAMEEAKRQLEEAASAGGRAICAVSGGLVSTVAAIMGKQAFGDRMTAVFVETGLMRENEGETVRETYEALGIPLVTLDIRDRMLKAFSGVRGRQQKRNAVQKCLLEALEAEAGDASTRLIIGTDYTDRLFGRMTPKEFMQGEPLEPLSICFRREVRAMAERLGVPAAIRERKAFPPLGLGALVMGEIREEKLSMLRSIDAIFREELEGAGLMPKLYDFYPLLSEEGAFGGGRQVLLCAHTRAGGVLVPARLPYDLVERTVSRIMEDYPSVTRVMLDETKTEHRIF